MSPGACLILRMFISPNGRSPGILRSRASPSRRYGRGRGVADDPTTGVTMRSAYRSVLRRGDVLSALVPYVFARLPLTMAPLALLLLTQQETGSYHWAGLVCGAYAISVAAAAPVLGRMVDRHGQS